MGPKNGHMTQEVLIRVFPGFTHAQRKKQFSFYKGWEAGEAAHGSGWPCWRRLPGWRRSEAGTEREGRTCGVRERKERGEVRRDLVPATGKLRLPQSSLLTVAALRCLMPVACSAKPTRVWGGDRSFLSSRGTDSGTHLVLNEYLSDQWGLTDECANDFENNNNKKSHRGNPLSPLSN